MTIVITGLGLITPSGRGVDAAWEGVLAGKPTAGHDAVLAEAGVPVTISCRAPDIDADAELGRGSSRRLDRFTHLAALAAEEAVEAARLDGDVDRDRLGVVVGSGIGGAETWAEEYPRFLERGPGRVSPMFVPRMLSNTAAGTIAIRLGARGPNTTVNTACAAGASAIHTARDLLATGQADMMLAGGVEAGVTALAVAAFAQMGALSHNPDPATASRPFDVDRDGFVMGEGAGFVVLETADSASRRGVTPLAVLAGCGASADAHHPTAPPEDGSGAALAMQRALDDAGFGPADLDHVNAHGTSTPLNDAAEARALRTVFGGRLDEIPVTSTKGVTGHLLGAAGAVEAAFVVRSLQEQTIPPTANLVQQDPEIDLDVVSGTARQMPLRTAMTNSFGFGGQNAVLIFTRGVADA